MKRDNAFTGLEAAIVLIAFVVVAAIFSYVMLGAGFFATQKAQEVTYAGVKQTTSNLIPDGTVYGNMTGGALDLVQVSLSVPVGGQPQQFRDLMITYSQEGQTPLNYNYTGTFGVKPDGSPDIKAGTFGTKGCSVGVTEGPTFTDSTLVHAGSSCNVVLHLVTGPKSGEWFQLEIKPPIGAPTTMRKTIPTGYNGGKLL